MSATLTVDDLLAKAHDYGRASMSIFPCHWHPGADDHKAPMPQYAWRAMATRHIGHITEDFMRAAELWGAENVMVGWACGEDGYVAIDMDVGDEPDWIQAFDWCAAVNPTAKGRHLVTKFPIEFEPGNGVSNFPTRGWGEVRGRGGYIIVAGPDRPGMDPAELHRCQPFPRPEWLIPYGGPVDAVSKQEVVEFTTTYTRADMPNAIHGIETMLARFDERRAAGTIESRHNMALNTLILAGQDAIKGKYGFYEGVVVVKTWWATCMARDNEQHRIGGREWANLMAWAVGRALQLERPPTVDDPVEPEPHESPLPSDGITPLSWTELWRQDRSARTWLVEHLLPEGRSVSLTADAKAGKSDLTLYLAGCLAMGIDPWTRQPQDPIRVAYFDFEMTEDDVIERLTNYGWSADDDWSHLDYYLLPPMLPLDSTQGAGQMLEIVEATHPALVVIDTLMRTLQGDENDAKTFQAFYRGIGLPMKARKITTLRLDHYGKDRSKGTRGSTAKDADVDVIWGMSVSGRYSRRLTSRSRVSWVPERIFLERYANPNVHWIPRDQVTDSIPTPVVDELIKVLDMLEIPLTWGRDKARGRLAEQGYAADTNQLALAIKLRKARGPALYVVPDRSDQD